MRLKPLLNSILILLVVISSIACDSNTENKKPIHKPIALKLKSPPNNTQYSIGDKIELELEIIHPDDISELTIKLNNLLYKSEIKPISQNISIQTKQLSVGPNNIFISYKNMDGKVKGISRNVFIFSDIVPDQKFANILRTYPHNTRAFTQGLEFYNGELYESTGSGNGSESYIAKVNFVNSKIQKKNALNRQFFGEGITILNDTIYQIVWKGQKCFMYDLEFNKIGEFSYQGEGWGLSNDGKSIIMTNGSTKIMWRNPKTFEIEKEIYAVSNTNDYPQLNEIELINNRLFANVYTENYIIEIDTSNGKVLSIIDCTELNTKGTSTSSDVLNGIAYNHLTNQIFLTGKLWNKLFEVNFD